MEKDGNNYGRQMKNMKNYGNKWKQLWNTKKKL